MPPKLNRFWSRIFEDFAKGDIISQKGFPEIEWKIVKITKETIYLEAIKKNSGLSWNIPNNKNHPLYKMLRRDFRLVR